MNNIDTVEKEQIPSLEFYKEDVLVESEIKTQRLNDLKKAATLGNGYRRKVKLTFKKSDGLLNQVDTTVWAVGNSFVTLKAGITIPINSILDVNF